MATAVAAAGPSALGEFQTLGIDQLFESPLNVRRHFSAAAMAELVASVRQVGVLTPLLVRPNLAFGGFEIAAGHRRFRAATEAGVQELPVRVLNLSDQAFLEVITIENLQRQDVHPLDEADGYQALMKADKAYTVEAIAAKVGKSPSYVYQRLKLLNLTPDVREAWDADEITPAHAVRLARLAPAQQKDALTECWHPLYGRDSGGQKAEPAPLSQLERWIERHVLVAPTAPETAYFFPEIAEQLAAEEQPEKLLQLSESHMPGADLGTKKHGIIGQGRWTRITGPKNRCANIEKGVVVHGGAMRVLEVCATKGCPKHFPERKKTKATKTSTSDNHQDRWKREQEERARKAKAWEGVRERALTLTAVALKKSGPDARVIEALTRTMHFYGGGDGKLFKDLMGPITAENVAIAMLFYRLVDNDSRAFDEFSRIVKPFGVNLKALEAEYRAAAAPPKAETKTPAKSKPAKSAKKARR